MDKFSQELLKFYNKRSNLSIMDIGVIFDANPLNVIGPPVSELHSKGFLAIDQWDKDKSSDGLSLDAKLYITQAGKSKLYEIKQEECDRKHKIYFDWFYIALTTIAVIISIIALIKQLWT